MMRKTRLPSTEPTAQTRNMSSRRPESDAPQREPRDRRRPTALSRVTGYALRRSPSSVVTSVGCTLSSTTLRSTTHCVDVVAARQVVHDLEQHLFEDRPQPAGAGAALERLVGDGLERVVGEARGRRRRTGRTSGTASAARSSARRGCASSASWSRLCTAPITGQPADELGDEPELQEVLGQHAGEDARRRPSRRPGGCRRRSRRPGCRCGSR